jgi:ferric iron reductase protein FhuF
VAQLGLVARLLAPAVAAAAAGDALDLRPHALWWQDDLGGVYPLSVTRGAAELHGSAVERLTDLIGARYGVPVRTRWGNVASAVNSAANQIAAARPDLEPKARTAADRFLADPRLDGGVLRSGPAFRRRSCCLIYRAAGNRVAVCGDCVLTGATGTPIA